jgi:hypothetical protein
MHCCSNGGRANITFNSGTRPSSLKSKLRWIRPSDAHHLRFAQSRALGRKVSDEFTVPLCRGHHREVHHCGDERAWWQKVGLDPTAAARALWLETRPVTSRSNSATSLLRP